MRDAVNGRFSPTHNSSYTREYNIWGNMIYRCNTKSSPLYASYGGRGIAVCSEWLDFSVFISDMGVSPSKDHSIDRINVEGDYCKGNCRWATSKDQARNRRNSSMLVVDGVKIQVDDYCEKFGVSKMAIKNRIRRGWDNERIVSTPVRGPSKCS